VCGAPGDAFELVYQGNTNVVRQKMHKVDPVLGELIRVQLYGNIYSSPGISLSQKQLLMVAFLAVYDMPDQLFGHLLAAFRFGNTVKACEKAIHIAFEQSGETSPVVLQSAVDTLQQAYAFLQTDGGADWRQVDLRAEVSITDPNSSVTVPDLPEPFFSKEALESEFAWEGL
jgi:alkylhydroperoxidase/carboxymuconolactone decarboxylase family protein YurZ